jgi:hypothetical protein
LLGSSYKKFFIFIKELVSIFSISHTSNSRYQVLEPPQENMADQVILMVAGLFDLKDDYTIQ